MPEWYLLLGLLAVVSVLGLLWSPLLVAVPLLVVAALTPLAVAFRSAYVDSGIGYRSRGARLRLFLGSGFLHLIQPLARLSGRFEHGLTPWRRHVAGGFALPVARQLTLWSEQWRAPESWLETLEQRLRSAGLVILHGGDYDDWDMEVRSGVTGGVRFRMGVEEHGAGKQLMRFATRPVWGTWPRLVLIATFALSLLAGFSGAVVPGIILGALGLALLGGVVDHQGRALAALVKEVEAMHVEQVELVRRRAEDREPQQGEGAIVIELLRPNGRRADSKLLMTESPLRTNGASRAARNR
jgi:O-antigen biosynthesis protein